MTETSKGLCAMMLACVIWGLSPIAFKAMTGIPPHEVLAHRALWSLVIFGVLLAVQGRMQELFQALTVRRNLIYILTASCLIMSGWWVFIWSIQSGRTTQTALGFYIFPLVAVLLGRLVFAEALNRIQWGAVGLVALAVALLTYGLGAAPWVAVLLALNFAVYGVIKKRLGLGPVVSVTAEVLVMLPPALWILWQTGHSGTGHFGGWTAQTALLIFAGPLTAVPLILFSFAAPRLTLTSTGLVSYINPTLQFICAVALFSEPFTPWHLQAFALIWGALALYSWATYQRDRATRKAANALAASGTISM